MRLKGPTKFIHRFSLVRLEDVSGVSGIGVVAKGVRVGPVAFLRWVGEWPTIVLHLRGIRSIEHIHGHNGKTKIAWR